MGGGYFLYDSCGRDLLALDARTGRPEEETAGRLPRVPVPGPLVAAPSSVAVGVAADGASSAAPPYPNDAGEYACGQENAAAFWLNLPTVQKALHVRLVGKPRFSFSTGLRYNYTAHSLVAAYKSPLSTHFRILQYSGDADPCVPYVGAARWIESLGLPVSSPWRPWTAPHTMAVTGYVTEYNVSADPRVRAGLTFVTIRDAGHMVPRYKPRQAQWMISRWLSGKPLTAR